MGARATRSLSRSGAVAGFTLGTITVAAGWSWGILLLLLFITSSILSRVGEARKTALIGPVVEKDGERDAWQVLANGGMYAGAALGLLIFPSSTWYALGAGALAASTADTWATEVGTLVGGEPISVRSGEHVPPGTSGGITRLGTMAGIAGALFIAIAAALAGWPVHPTAAILGGIAGTLSDSILGAFLQARRHCDACDKATERLVHDCGTPTRHAGGITWLDNDAVNAVSTGVGALVGMLVS